jgi:hypothetical protein
MVPHVTAKELEQLNKCAELLFEAMKPLEELMHDEDVPD